MEFLTHTHNIEDTLRYYVKLNLSNYICIWNKLQLPLYRTLLNVLVIILSSGFGVSPI